MLHLGQAESCSTRASMPRKLYPPSWSNREYLQVGGRAGDDLGTPASGGDARRQWDFGSSTLSLKHPMHKRSTLEINVRSLSDASGTATESAGPIRLPQSSQPMSWTSSSLESTSCRESKIPPFVGQSHLQRRLARLVRTSQTLRRCRRALPPVSMRVGRSGAAPVGRALVAARFLRTSPRSHVSFAARRPRRAFRSAVQPWLSPR